MYVALLYAASTENDRDLDGANSKSIVLACGWVQGRLPKDFGCDVFIAYSYDRT